MRKFKILFIFGLLLSFFSCMAFAQDEGESEDKYGKEMYPTPETENPETYNPWSSYKGLVSERMLKSVQKLNKKSLRKLENPEPPPELEQAVELPELSEIFGRRVTMGYSESPENILPEGVSMEELAEAIVKELMELRKENKIPRAGEEREKESNRFSAVEEEREGKTPKNAKNSEEEAKSEEPVEEIEREVRLQESALTLTYLIFGKEVVIKAPQILADNFEQKENRLKKEIEIMATLLNERREE